MNTAQLRQKILNLAMRGKLVPQDPKDENASVLLVRIRAEKASATKAGNMPLNAIVTPKDIPFEVPASWVWCRLGDICHDFQYGTSQKSDKQGKVVVLRMGNLQKGKLDYSDLAYSSDDGDIEKYSLKPNELLFNRTNSPEWVGKTAIYRGERPSIFAGYLIRVVPILINPDYLNYLMNSAYHRDICAQAKTDGVNQSNINAQKLSNFIYPIAPLVEQQRIVDAIESAFSLIDEIEKNRNDLQTLVSVAKSKLLTLAVKGKLVSQDPNDVPVDVPEFVGETPFDVPERWRWTSLGDAFDMQAGKFIKASEILDDNNDGSLYPCYGGNGLRGYVNTYNTDGAFPLIGRQGALCGNLNFAEGKFYATEHAVISKPKADIDVRWAYYALSALNLNQYSTATAQPGLAVSKIALLPISIPPVPEQHRIVLAIEAAYEQLNSIVMSLE